MEKDSLRFVKSCSENFYRKTETVASRERRLLKEQEKRDSDDFDRFAASFVDREDHNIQLMTEVMLLKEKISNGDFKHYLEEKRRLLEERERLLEEKERLLEEKEEAINRKRRNEIIKCKICKDKIKFGESFYIKGKRICERCMLPEFNPVIDDYIEDLCSANCSCDDTRSCKPDFIKQHEWMRIDTEEDNEFSLFMKEYRNSFRLPDEKKELIREWDNVPSWM
jgi:hypothetical protein